MDRETIESIRRHSLGIMLMALIQDYESSMRRAYREAGFGDVRRSHGYVLRYLEQHGSRITDIARRAGITKQTAGKIVQELQRLGYVEIGGVAGDNRVRLVRFSRRGRALVAASQTLIAQLHDSYAERVGRTTFTRFEETLQTFVRRLEPAIPAMTLEAGGSNPFLHFGRFMVEVASDFEARLRQRLATAGFPDIKRSYLALLFHLDPGGSRLAGLAQRVAVTPQAASLTVNELVRAGYVRQEPDPSDQRARIIELTPRGLALLDAMAEAVEAINEDYAAVVGEEEVTRLRDCLQKILQRLRISVFA